MDTRVVLTFKKKLNIITGYFTLKSYKHLDINVINDAEWPSTPNVKQRRKLLRAARKKTNVLESKKVLCGVINLPTPSQRFNKKESGLDTAAETVATVSMQIAAKEAKYLSGHSDIPVNIDGT
ncbi:hypothetical protein TNCV_1558161 [Trichonephila clavipes]|uniref:Uncharacterized protein n=1 Tax=Trichonephila clavipes TaxID=2585209 RepID=A0A8X6UQR2_TRICX|nr:hypothetical protein TNCV_1558161 [Trichonephila clavipes]